ncbi:ATP:ADP antiporter, AAA family [Nematocida sp. AWRm80]|nr:ATP:ADP antiporter, AAA family [Nematocida sp. AWRm80]
MENTETENNYRQKSLPTEEEHEKKVLEECSTFFRVLPVEYPKFFCLAFLGFSISLIYSTLRDGKDTLIMGKMLPTSISFLKSSAVLIFTIIFGILFQYLLSRGVKMRSIMIGAQIGFGVYFAIYSLLIFTFSTKLEMYKFFVLDMFSDGKMKLKGLEFLKGFLYLFNFWTCSLFYVSAEMWGSFVLSLLFSGCVNEVCLLRQVLRFYPLFMIFANVALTASGLMGVGVSYIGRSKGGDFVVSFYRYFLLIITALCLINACVYKYLMDKIVPYPIYITDGPITTKKKVKVGMLAGIKAAFSNPIVLAMSISVMGYGAVTNLTEGSANTTINDVAMLIQQDKAQAVMKTKAIQQVVVGVLTIVFLLTPMKSFIQKHGWHALGMLSPLFSLFGSVAFFGCIWVNMQMGIPAAKATGITVTIGKKIGGILNLSLIPRKKLEKYLGMMVVCVIKILKYAAFDICKEAIGVKIPKEHRSKMKGIYDGVFGKLGKSLASGAQIILLIIFNTNDIRESISITMLSVVIISLLWIYSSVYLGKQYNKAVKEGKDLPVVLPESIEKT